MPRVEFEPMALVLERVKTIHALHRGVTVIGSLCYTNVYFDCMRWQ
jgi:hypothetical protein